VQPDHEAGGQSGPADAVAVERAEGGSEAIPVDRASEPHQRGCFGSTRFTSAERKSSGWSGGEDLGGLGGLLRGDAARESRRSAGINGRADLQAFRPLHTGTLQMRILADPKKPGRSAASGVFHGRLASMSCLCRLSFLARGRRIECSWFAPWFKRGIEERRRGTALDDGAEPQLTPAVLLPAPAQATVSAPGLRRSPSASG